LEIYANVHAGNNIKWYSGINMSSKMLTTRFVLCGSWHPVDNHLLQASDAFYTCFKYNNVTVCTKISTNI